MKKRHSKIWDVSNVNGRNIYPWDWLDVGDMFLFVPENAKGSNAKLVANANYRYRPKKFSCCYQFCIRVK